MQCTAAEERGECFLPARTKALLVERLWSISAQFAAPSASSARTGRTGVKPTCVALHPELIAVGVSTGWFPTIRVFLAIVLVIAVTNRLVFSRERVPVQPIPSQVQEDDLF